MDFRLPLKNEKKACTTQRLDRLRHTGADNRSTSYYFVPRGCSGAFTPAIPQVAVTNRAHYSHMQGSVINPLNPCTVIHTPDAMLINPTLCHTWYILYPAVVCTVITLGEQKGRLFIGSIRQFPFPSLSTILTGPDFFVNNSPVPSADTAVSCHNASSSGGMGDAWRSPRLEYNCIGPVAAVKFW